MPTYMYTQAYYYYVTPLMKSVAVIGHTHHCLVVTVCNKLLRTVIHTVTLVLLLAVAGNYVIDDARSRATT